MHCEEGKIENSKDVHENVIHILHTHQSTRCSTILIKTLGSPEESLIQPLN